MSEKSNRSFFCISIILILALVPISQTIPLNLVHPQTASATSGITANNVQSTSATLLLPSATVTISSFNASVGTNRTLVVGIESSDSGATSVTFGGASLTKAVSSFTNNDAEFWYLKHPNGTANIVVTMSLPTKVVVGAYALSGVDQYSPIAGSTTNHNTSVSSPTISITTKFANSLVLDSPAIYGGATLSSSTCTQQWNTNVGGLEPPHKITGASSSKIQTTAGSVTCSWTASVGELWDDVAIEVKTSTGITGILIPLYCDPYGGDDSPCSGSNTLRWQSVNDTKNNHHNVPIYLILNPKNGFQITNPSNCTDSVKNVADYARGAANLTKSGVIMLGYVSTNYTNVNSTIVKTQIDNYKNCIPSVKGIFFDEMANTAGHESYYQNLTNYAKGTDGMKYTVGNPGVSTISSYIGTVDNIVIWETNAMPTTSQLDTNTFNNAYDKHNFSFLSYAQSPIPSSSTLSTDAGDVGLMYVTDDGGLTDTDGDPWDQLTTYLSTLAADLDR